MSKVYYRKATETLYYEFWIRADSPEDAELAILNLETDELEKGVTDSEGFEIYDPEEFDEEELLDWVKTKIIDAKDVLE